LTPERKKFIREHWSRNWMKWPRGRPNLKVAVRSPKTNVSWDPSPFAAVNESIEVLEFQREQRIVDDKTIVLIVCEGVIMEEFVK
jgi:hypothetical protein